MGDVQLFLVRVWQEDQQFRASVRAADEEQLHLFRASAPLGEFLARAAGPRPAPAGDPGRNDPCPDATRSAT